MTVGSVPFLIGFGLAIGVAVFARLAGLDRDRAFYPTVLIVIAALYVLFAVMAERAANLSMELMFFVLFTAAAVVAFRTNLWIAAAALVLHGVFDFFRAGVAPNPGAPEWWPDFCLGYDVAAALALAALIVTSRLAPTGKAAAS